MIVSPGHRRELDILQDVLQVLTRVRITKLNRTMHVELYFVQLITKVLIK